MWLSSRLRSGQHAPTVSRREQTRTRPTLERLEDRCLLSAGAPVPTFGIAVVTFTDSSSPYGDSGQALAVQTDGKIVVVGVSAQTYEKDFAVARYNTDGSLDSSFGNSGKATTDLDPDPTQNV